MRDRRRFLVLLVAATGCTGPAGPAGPVGLASPTPYFDVRTFGALGDGAHDDTTAIQSAVDRAAGGGTVYVPAGTYLVNGSDGAASTGVSLGDATVLELAPGAILQAMPTASERYSILRIVSRHDVTVRGGLLVGERDRHLGVGGEHGFGVEVRGAERVTLEGVSARDFWGDGFYVGTAPGGAGSRDITVTGCRSSHNRRQGLSIVHCSGASITRSLFEDTSGTQPEAGIDLEPDLGTVVEDVRISDCRLRGNTHGIFVAGGFAEFGMNRFNSITANIIEGNTRAGVALVAVTSISIDDNLVTGNGEDGIQLYRSTDSAVSRNLIANSGHSGIALLSSSNNAVRDNVITANGRAADASFDQIRIASASSDNAIQDNTCRAGDGPVRARYGLRVDSPDCAANVVAGNDLFMSGEKGGFSDAGAGTVTLGGNRE